MTDTTNDTAAAIDAMVNGSGAHVSPTPAPSPDMRLDGATGQVTVIGKAAQTNASSRLHDDGSANFPAQVFQQEQRIGEMEAELNRNTFDPNTGAASPAVSGHAREVLAAQLQQAKNTAAYLRTRGAAIQQQRDADAVAQQSANAEALARAAFVQGSPERAQLLNDAIAREEAEALARSIVNARRAPK